MRIKPVEHVKLNSFRSIPDSGGGGLGDGGTCNRRIGVEECDQIKKKEVTAPEEASGDRWPLASDTRRRYST